MTGMYFTFIDACLNHGPPHHVIMSLEWCLLEVSTTLRVANTLHDNFYVFYLPGSSIDDFPSSFRNTSFKVVIETP